MRANSIPEGVARWLPRLLLTLALVHFARGILPFSPVEGDDLACVNGLEHWARDSGPTLHFAYLYEVQSGSYQLLRWLHWLSGQDYFILFSSVTVFGAAGFIFVSSWLLAAVTKLRPVWCALAVIACQEFTAAAYYANTSALAGAAVLTGIWLTTQITFSRVPWLGGVLIGLGLYLRLDSVLLAPAIFGFQLLLAPHWRAACRQTVTVAIVSGLTLIALLALSGTSLLAAWHILTLRGLGGDGRLLFLEAPLVLSYAGLGIGMIGYFVLLTLRLWRLAGLIAIGVVPSLLVYGPNLTTTKYFYYAAPFLLLPGVWLVARCLLVQGPWQRPAQIVFVLLIIAPVLENCCGLQSSSPQFRRFDPAPLDVILARLAHHDKTMELGWGEGEIIPTDDGFRLRGGLLYAPTVWHREKAAMIEDRRRLDHELGTGGSLRVITSTYLSMVVVENWLIRHGYNPQARQFFPANPTSWTVAWTTGLRTVTLVVINHTERDRREFSATAQLGGSTLFVNDRGRLAFQHLAKSTGPWQLLSVGDNNLLALYRR